jgi:hypothetical protein
MDVDAKRPTHYRSMPAPSSHPDHAHENPRNDRELMVKFVARGNAKIDPVRWLRQFPKRIPVWGRCRFSFDPDLRNYDWLVAYDDLPTGTSETLTCPKGNTILVTSEPSSVKIYGSSFLRQFGIILTSQEPWVIRQPNAVHSQAGLKWFYGFGKHSIRDHDELSAMEPLAKTKQVSTVCSSKQQRHTLHQQRYNFVKWLGDRIPELDVFGHGIRFIDDKAEAMDPYRYHIAIENHVNEHHWTEKLADCYLGWCLPVYHGCPNAADYFPKDSFVAIDIREPQAAEKTIRDLIRNDEYARRLGAIAEARHRILNEYNLFAVISRLIENHTQAPSPVGSVLHSRHSLRKSRMMLPLLEIFWEKIRYRILARSKKNPRATDSNAAIQPKNHE